MFNIFNKLFRPKQKDKDSTQLHKEALYGNLDSIKILLQKGLDVNATNANHLTPLDFAVWKNHVDIVKFLIAHGANVNYKVTRGFTPLTVASQHGHLDIVNILIENGAYLNATTNLGNTSLHLAAKKGHLDIVNVLIDRGSNVNAKNCDQVTPLHSACIKGHLKIVKRLIAHGSDINATQLKGFTSLYLAIEQQKIEVVDFLIENGANVNVTEDHNWTPLHIAAYNGCSFNIVKILVEKGANVNAKKDGKTALHFAAEKNFLEIVDFLIKNKADVNAIDNRFWTPLLCATYKGHLEVIKLLLEKGADVNASNDINWSPLHYAVRSGYQEIVETLIINGGDVNARSKGNLSPLHLGVIAGYLNVVKLLIINEACFDFESNLDDYVKSLDIAKDIQVLQVIRFLALIKKLFKATKDNSHFKVENCLRKGAVADCRNSCFETPLLYASWKGYVKIVDLLLQYYANPNCTTDNNLTPLHYAAKFNHLEVIYSLLRHGAIFDIASSKGNKRPLDFAHDEKNTNIEDLLLLIDRLFKEVKDGDSKIIKELENIRDKNPNELFSILNTCNIKKQTLIQVALDNDNKVIANSLLNMLSENEYHYVQASELELNHMILQNSNYSTLESDVVNFGRNPKTRKLYRDLLVCEILEN